MKYDQSISYPPSYPSEYPRADSASSSYPSSRFSSLTPSKYQPGKTVPHPLPPPSFFLTSDKSVITGTSPSDLPSLLKNLVPS